MIVDCLKSANRSRCMHDPLATLFLLFMVHYSMKEPGLTGERILEATRECAAEDGLAGVSMRRVAARLQLSSTALYHHFQNKDALLDCFAEREANAIKLEPNTFPWQHRLRKFILDTQAMLDHFPGLNYYLITHLQTPANLIWTESVLEILEHAGFSSENIWRALAMLSFFISPRSMIGDRDTQQLVTQADWRLKDIKKLKRYPTLERLLEQRHNVAVMWSYYEIVLDDLIDALSVQLAKNKKSPSPKISRERHQL